MTKDTTLEAGFDHPCKDTCSGWKQGRERGLLERDQEIKMLREQNAVLVRQLRKIAHNWVCDEIGHTSDGYRTKLPCRECDSWIALQECQEIESRYTKGEAK